MTSVSQHTYKLIVGKSILNMIKIQCFSELKKLLLDSIQEQRIVIETTQNHSFKYYIILSIILPIICSSYLDILSDFCKFFGFESTKKRFRLILPKATKKLNHICTKYITIMNSKLILEFFIIILTLGFLKNLNDPLTHVSIIDTNTNNFINLNYCQFVTKLYINEKIWGIFLGCENESIIQGRSYYQNNINISECFFSRSSIFSGKGGVIFVDGDSYSMIVIYSMFYFCVCSSHGGAIFFKSLDSDLRMICANSCSCGSYTNCHFAFLVAIQKNQVDYLSVSNSSLSTNGYWVIDIVYGNQTIDNTNSSMNHAYLVSGIGISSPSSCTSSQCTFSNNNVDNNMCIRLFSDSGTILMSYTNIVHNNSPSYGVVDANGAESKKMMYCIFYNNQNYLFCIEKGSLEVSHSFIDHSLSSFSNSFQVSTETNNSFSNRMTYHIQFFNSHHCNTDIPPPSRTIDQSPMSSLEETISRTNEETLTMTNERTIDQTIRETPKNTIPRSYAEIVCTNQIANNREINMIFSFSILCLTF